MSGTSRGIRLHSETLRSINESRIKQFTLPLQGLAQLALPLVGRVAAGSPILAQEHVDQKQAEEQAKKFLEARFTLDDFLSQLKQVRKLGPLSQLLSMVPGMNQMAKQMPEAEAERELTKLEAIISSMTMAERADPSIISGSRRRRIARGSGTTVQDVNQLLKQFLTLQQTMRQMRGRVPAFRMRR